MMMWRAIRMLASAMWGWVQARLNDEGPAVLPALIRILIVALLWSRFGKELRIYRLADLVWVGTSLAFWTASILVAVGYKVRFTSVLLSGVAVWMVLGMGVGWGYHDWLHHHTWLLLSATMLLPLCASGHALSLDAWSRKKRGEHVRRRVPYWGLRMIAMQVAACYAFGAWDKLHWSFLNGDRMMHHMINQMFGSGYALLDSSIWVAVFVVFAVGTVVLEFFLAVALWNRRLRPWAAMMGIGLHIGIYLTLPVSTFSATICVFYLCFLDEDDVRWLLGRRERL